MKLKLMTLFVFAGLVSGCAATITPRGDIYTQALVPAVVVESHPRTVFVSTPHRQAPRPIGPIASGRRYAGHTPKVAPSHGNPRTPQGGHRR